MSICSTFNAGSFRNRHSATSASTSRGVLFALVLAAFLAGCASEEVGHSKTTTKRTIDTPTEKTIVTETHEKDTTLTPR